MSFMHWRQLFTGVVVTVSYRFGSCFFPITYGTVASLNMPVWTTELKEQTVNIIQLFLIYLSYERHI